MTINVSLLPTFTINLSDMDDAIEVSKIMQRHHVTDYCYSFLYKNQVMKYGISCDNEWKTRGHFGDRVYRQAWHIPGWATPCSPNMSGWEFCETIDKFPGINKNDVQIKIWNMSRYPFLQANNHTFELEQVENYLIETHNQIIGYVPVGNKSTVSYIKKKTVVADATFNKNFEVLE